MQEIIMIWFLLCTLWTVAFIFNIWLLPEILIYAMAKFATTYFGGVAPEFPTWQVVAASIINSMCVTLTFVVMVTGV